MIPKPQKVTQDEARLNFVRKMACLIWDEWDGTALTFLAGGHVLMDCGEPTKPSEAHHVRKGSHAGMRTKPPANRTVPLCANAHKEYHRIGHDTFCAKYGLDLEAHLERINAEFAKLPKREKRERKPSIRVKSIAVSCDCRLKRHGLKPIECSFEHDRVNYRCPVTHTMKSARFAA